MSSLSVVQRAPGWLALSMVVSLTVACGKPAPVPPGYTALDDNNLASFPAAQGGDQHPEQLSTVSGHNDSGGYDYADGQGYIHASIADVWAAMQMPNVMVQHRNLSSCKIDSTGANTTADYSYQVTVSQSIDTFSLAARELATDGTKSAPKEVVFRDDLVSATTLNQTDSDSIILGKVDSGTTSYSVIRHEWNSGITHPADVRQYIGDIYNAVVAQVHGNAIPFESMSPCSS